MTKKINTNEFVTKFAMVMNRKYNENGYGFLEMNRTDGISGKSMEALQMFISAANNFFEDPSAEIITAVLIPFPYNDNTAILVVGDDEGNRSVELLCTEDIDISEIERLILADTTDFLRCHYRTTQRNYGIKHHSLNHCKFDVLTVVESLHEAANSFVDVNDNWTMGVVPTDLFMISFDNEMNGAIDVSFVKQCQEEESEPINADGKETV